MKVKYLTQKIFSAAAYQAHGQDVTNKSSVKAIKDSLDQENLGAAVGLAEGGLSLEAKRICGLAGNFSPISPPLGPGWLGKVLPGGYKG